MLRTVVVAGCLLVAGVTLAALLVSHQALLKKGLDVDSGGVGALDRARRSIIQLLSTDADETPAGGAVYTIWGRTQCPYGASLVYKGVVGGTHYTNTGGGSEYICLVEEPEWDKFIGGDDHNGYSHMVGTGFKAGDGLFNMENVYGARLVNQNAVCAVCHIPRPVQVMIPGRKSCMVGWHMEYYGYLMSSKASGITKTNYICVDIAPEADRSGSDAEGGAELWPVEARCGYSLPCPKYEHNKELTCAVCSK